MNGLPKRFKLGGRMVNVSEVETLAERLGHANAPLGIIEIEKKFNGEIMPMDQKQQTFFHELMHCIFYEVGRNDLADDETLVQCIAVMLHQFHMTVESD